MLGVALCPEESLESRLAAVAALATLGTPPASVSEAEDALHRLLRMPSGVDVNEVRGAAEAALWRCWHTSGDQTLDNIMKRGVALMDDDELEEAVDCFTELVTLAPEFAEGWNKRATLLYMLKDYNRSVQDCKEVLRRKPRHFGCLHGIGLCFLSLEDDQKALVYFKKAAEVHPGNDSAWRYVANAAVKNRLNGLIQDCVQRLRSSTDSDCSADIIPLEREEALDCNWEVHRVRTSVATGAAYFFRVNVTNVGNAVCPVKSIARYYVLKLRDGTVFPFMRLTEADTSFTLQPGQRYRFCWMLILASELQYLHGGVLMESKDLDTDARRDEYPRTCFEPLLQPALAPVIPMGEIERLSQGYFYTGQLDLRQGVGI